ncbi:MAG: hypothetical protein AAFV85_23025 [Cyanobacteria bacterium J06634_6]
MKIEFEGLDVTIELGSKFGLAEIKGADAETVLTKIHGAYGMFGHTIEIDDNVHDFDLWHAILTNLREFNPKVDEAPTPSEIPEDSVS